MSLDLTVWGSLFRPRRGSGEQVAGYRLCRIDEQEDKPVLCGVGIGHEYHWRPGWNRAACEAGRHHLPPGRRCSCGLYACSDLAALLRNVGTGETAGVLVGVVGTGGLEIHERGWRAQFARIVGISRDHIGRVVKRPDGRVLRITSRKVLDAETLAELGRMYEVPVTPLSELEQLLAIAITRGEEHGSR